MGAASARLILAGRFAQVVSYKQWCAVVEYIRERIFWCKRSSGGLLNEVQSVTKVVEYKS
jgi:hypothetical protein